MATGDFIVFDEAKAKMLSGDWASTDIFNCAILDDTTTPDSAIGTPVLGDFTQVGAAGSYAVGGTALGTLAALVSEAAGVMTFDSGVNPTWPQHASNDTDAFWALIYNFTDAGKDALGFLELGGPINMSTGALTITWNASGIFTVT